MTNLLKNPGFELLPVKPPTRLVGNNPPAGKAGGSAADPWTVWNNNPGVTTTDILPSTRPGGGTHMLHVCTTGPLNGIVQQFMPSTPHTMSSVWVFVLRGQVGMGTGDAGNTHPHDARSQHQGTWEQLPPSANGVSPANEFIVYAISPEGACYYVDGATVSP